MNSTVEEKLALELNEAEKMKKDTLKSGAAAEFSNVGSGCPYLGLLTNVDQRSPNLNWTDEKMKSKII